MSEVRIAAEPRTEFGKGGARRTRRAGKVPAVLYGHGTEVRHISLPARELSLAFKRQGGANVLLTLELGDGAELALPRQVQRHPIRGELTHVDLLLVRRGERVAVDVPVRLVGEAPGVKLGGMLDNQLTVLNLEADATMIPAGIDVDLSGLDEVGASIHARDITLPEGVMLLTDPDAIVIHVIGAPTEAELEAELDAAAAAAAPPPTPEEEAATAAAAAAPEGGEEAAAPAADAPEA